MCGKMPSRDYQNLCEFCDEFEDHKLHHDVANPMCEVCVDKAVDYADHMRDVLKEA